VFLECGHKCVVRLDVPAPRRRRSPISASLENAAFRRAHNVRERRHRTEPFNKLRTMLFAARPTRVPTCRCSTVNEAGIALEVVKDLLYELRPQGQTERR